MWPCHVPCRLRLIVGHLGDFIPRRVSSPEASREGRAGMEKGISPIAVSADGPCAHRSTHSAVTSPGRSQQTQPEGIIGRFELPRLRGHPMVGAERSAHDAAEPSAVSAGVPAADDQVGSARPDPGRALAPTVGEA